MFGYNEMFGFFLDNGLISVNQSSFKPGDPNFYHKRKIFKNHLMMVMKLVVFSLRFQRHLIKSRTMALYSNYEKMRYRVTY